MSTDETTVPGLATATDELRLELDQTELTAAEPGELSFRIVAADGSAVEDFDVEHEKRMHLIVVRRDLTGFQHLHPEMGADGTWATSLTLPEPGSYRVFADFSHGGTSQTLGADLAVDGAVEWQELPAPRPTASTGDYEVALADGAATAGQASELAFTVTRDGEPVQVEPYLGADGHLVALREGDLGFLHVHPVGGDSRGADDGEAIRFMTEFPSAGRYRLFLQFRHDGRVHTAAFTREVAG